VQQEIDQHISNLEELLKKENSIDQISKYSDSINEQFLKELQEQAKVNTEIWKLEKIIKS